jgi:hypothetical protein
MGEDERWVGEEEVVSWVFGRFAIDCFVDKVFYMLFHVVLVGWVDVVDG